MSERKVKFFQGCLTHGLVDRANTIHCGNEECTSCNNFAEQFHDHLSDYARNLEL